jgi:hypothetical protein
MLSKNERLGGNVKDGLRVELKQLLTEETLRMLEEQREEIIKRTENRIKELQQTNDDTDTNEKTL